MKPSKKKKFDIKQFFILNGEKIALVLIIPLAIYIALQGTKYEPLPWKPDDLKRISQEADTHVRTNERKASDEGVSVFHYDSYASWIKIGVKPDLYRTETQWMPSLFPEKIKRSSVQIFTVTDLKAQTGLGALTVNPSSPHAAEVISSTLLPGQTPRIGKRWAIITGLIPIKQQLDAYVNTFSSSVLPDPIRDTPMYYLYDVERAEVEPGAGIDDLKWKKLDFVGNFVKERSIWGSFAQDLVDPNYLAPTPPGAFPMAFPLPPVDKKYGEEIAHPPVIPMLSESQLEQMKIHERQMKKQIEEMFKVDERNILEADPFGHAAGGGIGGESSMGSGPGMGVGPGLGAGPRRPGAKTEVDEDLKPISVEDYLFRFLDFTAEPGKTYRYRVRLYLANPNYRLAPNYLAVESLSKERYLITDFSAPSNSVTMPLESRILVTDVIGTDLRSPWNDPAASIMAVYFDTSDGSEWYLEKARVYRGSTINDPKGEVTNSQTKLPTSPIDSGDMGMGSAPPNRGKKPAPKKPAPTDTGEKKTINVVSDVCVLDMVGGHLLKGSPTGPQLRSPGKILVLEPSGNLVIRKVETDFAEVDAIKYPTTQHQSSFGMEGGSGMGMGPPGM